MILLISPPPPPTTEDREAPSTTKNVYSHLFKNVCQDSNVYQDNLQHFEGFLKMSLELPLLGYIYVALEAIRTRHPSASFLVESRYDLFVPYRELVLPRSSNSIVDALATVFCAACRYHSMVAFRLLKRGIPDVQEKDRSGITPLMSAVIGQDFFVCEQLLHHGADPNAYVSCNFRTNGPKAWGQDKWLRKQGCCSFSDSKNLTCPLSEALRVGNLAIFKLLLEHGADPWCDYGYAPDLYECEVFAGKNKIPFPRTDGADLDDGSSVLATIAACSDEVFYKALKSIRSAEKRGHFDINKRENISGKTLLHRNVRAERWSTCLELILDGADVNAPDARDWTPIHEMCALPHTAERIDTLLKLQKSADLRVGNGNGKTPFQLLKQSLSAYQGSPDLCWDRGHLSAQKFTEVHENRLLQRRMDAEYGAITDFTSDTTQDPGMSASDFYSSDVESDLDFSIGSDDRTDMLQLPDIQSDSARAAKDQYELKIEENAYQEAETSHTNCVGRRELTYMTKRSGQFLIGKVLFVCICFLLFQQH